MADNFLFFSYKQTYFVFSFSLAVKFIFGHFAGEGFEGAGKLLANLLRLETVG